MPWFTDYDMNMLVLIQQIAADRLSAFAWLDVLVSGEKGVFVAIESRRLKMRHGPWAAMSAAVITTGSALWHFYGTLGTIDGGLYPVQA
ncbi:hypothetical protein BWD09_08805 [Neisseria dentiae]|uniref:Uncharacterized protein n=1 Tax=Neisseria dentiae TaxID=194197 RepID=A0A1X3D674_9NEIS|nr:DUF2834 domain-containing protein [Neisseria dentiae]OSI15408.1 hypothetical protein BWD09_08805 [Neisseria dentiae]